MQTALTALGGMGADRGYSPAARCPGAAVTITFAGSLAVGPRPLIAVAANTLTGGTTPAPAIVSTTPGVATADVQTLSLTGGPTSGTFTLTFQAQTTAGIPWNATNAQVQAALSGPHRRRNRQRSLHRRSAARAPTSSSPSRASLRQVRSR